MTVRDIAKLANVSPATVSNVINDRPGVSAETREKVKKILEDNDYTIKNKANISKGSILFLKYMTHGKAVKDNKGFITTLIDSIENECHKYGFELTFMNASPKDISQTIYNININKPDGVIFLATEYRSGIDCFVKDIKVPIVALDNSMNYDEVDTVLMNNRRIMHIILDYLTNHNNKKILYIKSNENIDNLDERYLYFKEYIVRNNLHLYDPLEVTPNLLGSYNDLYDIFDKINWSTYDAVVCDLDAIALGLLRIFDEKNIKVPKEISVVGIDNIPYGSISKPPLTTVDIDKKEIGKSVVSLINRRISGEEFPCKVIKIDGKLIVRDSTK